MTAGKRDGACPNERREGEVGGVARQECVYVKEWKWLRMLEMVNILRGKEKHPEYIIRFMGGPYKYRARELRD